MHILLGLLGTIVTILVLLNRLAEAGIDLGGLNPFLWQRRREWRQKYAGDPLFSLEDPMEVTSLLTVAAAKCDGDMTSQEKRLILRLFEEEFEVSKRDASGLMVSCVQLLKDPRDVTRNLPKIVSPSKGQFTSEQVASAVDMVTKVVDAEGDPSEIRKEYLLEVKKHLPPASKDTSKWAVS